jgi:hypothetical protein
VSDVARSITGERGGDAESQSPYTRIAEEDGRDCRRYSQGSKGETEGSQGISGWTRGVEIRTIRLGRVDTGIRSRMNSQMRSWHSPYTTPDTCASARGCNDHDQKCPLSPSHQTAPISTFTPLQSSMTTILASTAAETDISSALLMPLPPGHPSFSRDSSAGYKQSIAFNSFTEASHLPHAIS